MNINVRKRDQYVEKRSSSEKFVAKEKFPRLDISRFDNRYAVESVCLFALGRIPSSCVFGTSNATVGRQDTGIENKTKYGIEVFILSCK